MLKRFLSALISALLVSCGGGGTDGGSNAGGSSQGVTAPSITVQPASQSVAVGATATFSVTASGSGLTYQWQKAGSAISGATASSYTTAPTTRSDSGTTFAVVISSSSGSITSSAATLTVTAGSSGGAGPPPMIGTDVTTYKNDVSRSGANLAETKLTLANVNPASFGLLRRLSVDGKVDAQPLYLSALTIGGAAHDVIFVATEHDSVYAFDANTGATLWHTSVLGSGETLSDTHGCGQVTPEIGITSTPVIDRAAAPNGAIYVVAMSKSGSTYHQRVHALDVTSGAELAGGPAEITATYPTAGGGTTSFDPGQYEERAALLLANGSIYTSWTSHCDIAPYTGWIIAFNQATLARTAVLNVGPNSGGVGPSIWMSGGGPAADSAGNIYLLTANGAFETTLVNGFPSKQDYGNSFLKLASGAGSLAVVDYFTMSNEVSESNADQDLGSGGELLLPEVTDANGTVRHLVVGAGKDGHIYVVDRDSMGHFSSSTNNIWQDLSGALPGGIWSTPAWFNGTLFYGESRAALKAFRMSNARFAASPASQTTTHFAYPGTAPAISANGTANGIVWAHENGSPAVLHAYDATDLSHELYNSTTAANGRDQFGTGNKFITPTIADGRVLIGTTAGVAVFGLLQ